MRILILLALLSFGCSVDNHSTDISEDIINCNPDSVNNPCQCDGSIVYCCTNGTVYNCGKYWGKVYDAHCSEPQFQIANKPPPVCSWSN